MPKLTCLSASHKVQPNQSIGETLMKRFTSRMLALAVGLAGGLSLAQAQETLKIGVILPYSGQFADGAAQMDNGIKLFMQQNGDTVAGRKIEIIRKDAGGIAPDVAKRLAQELVVRDRVRSEEHTSELQSRQYLVCRL